MPAGLEPGYPRWSRSDEKATVFQTTNATGGPKWKDIVGRTTVNSDTAEVLDWIHGKKGEDLCRTVIKDGTEVSIDTYIWYRFADAEPPKPPGECKHVSKDHIC